MKMKLGTLLYILIFKQLQEIDNLELSNRRPKQELQKEWKKITQIALQINFLKLANIIPILR